MSEQTKKNTNDNNDNKDEAAQPQAAVQAQSEAEAPIAMPSEVEQLKQQLAEMEDKFLRSKAEVENIRKRSERDIADAHKYALENCLTELTLVLDSLEQAVQSTQKMPAGKPKAKATERLKDAQNGIEMCYKLFLDTLTRFGVQQLNPLNEAFDPNQHEAIAMVPHPEAKPGVVLEVFQRGYLLNNRLVRAAKVIISQTAAEPETASKAPAADANNTTNTDGGT